MSPSQRIVTMIVPLHKGEEPNTAISPGTPGNLDSTVCHRLNNAVVGT